MKMLKKNKYTVIAVCIFILLVLFLYEAKQWFFPDTGKALYGDRLVGKVEVSSETYDALVSKIKENPKVKEATVRENGKSINVYITVQADTSIEEAKALTNNMLEPFSDSQVGYYDFQVIVVKEEESENNFPIIGNKHHNGNGFSWTKDRAKTEITDTQDPEVKGE